MSKLVESVLKVPFDDTYALGWQPYRHQKLQYLLENVPVEFHEFGEIAIREFLDTVRQEIQELGYTDEEIVSGENFLRVQIKNDDNRFSLFADKENDSFYKIQVCLEKTVEEFEDGFFERYIVQYYKLLVYFATKFVKLRMSLMCLHPTYIARKQEDTGNWVHRLELNDSFLAK